MQEFQKNCTKVIPRGAPLLKIFWSTAKPYRNKPLYIPKISGLYCHQYKRHIKKLYRWKPYANNFADVIHICMKILQSCL